MVNLIPNEERKKMIRDFNIRLCVTACVTIGFAALVASVAMLPAYFASSVKLDLVADRFETQKGEPVPLVGQKSLEVVQDLKKKIGTIDRARNAKFVISEQVIDVILNNRMSDIKINQITYEDNTQQGKNIGLTGVAPSRERLLLFRRALEEDPSFAKVDLPISNFIKGSNIEFYLTLIPS